MTDVGKYLLCRVTATNASGSAQAFSNVVGPVAAASGGWTPADLPGLIAWYKADTGVTTSAGNVTAVADQSSAGNNLVIGGTGTVAFDATSDYNGHPAFDFNTSGGCLICSPFSIGTGATLSVFVVGQIKSTSENFCGVVVYATGGNDYNVDGNGSFVNLSGGNIGSSIYSTNAVIPMTTDANHRFGNVVGSNLTMYVDGVAGTGVAATHTAWISGGTLVIGQRYLSGAISTGFGLVGPILEIVISTAALSPSDIADLDAYFVGRHGT